ncbi:hypothetical protein PCE1_000808 [Barthelona sp. PCE]
MNIFCQLINEEGVPLGPQINVPRSVGIEELTAIVTSLDEEADEDRVQKYSFYVDNEQIESTLDELVTQMDKSTETTVEIVYQKESLFRVRPATRCSSTIPAHNGPVLTCSISPDTRYFATAGADRKVHVWMSGMQLPFSSLEGHTANILALAWSPDGQYLASGDRDGKVVVWRMSDKSSRTLQGHTKFITSMTFLNTETLASASKDTTVRIWNTRTGRRTFTLTTHTKTVRCLAQMGDYLLTGSEDRSIIMWNWMTGQVVQTFTGHAHWVNRIDVRDEHHFVSCSDDFVVILWNIDSRRPVKKLTGHQRPVTDIKFSPNGRFLASCSFDKAIKIWNPQGTFIKNLRGHVKEVYLLAWAKDSHLLASCSGDSTVKIWDVTTGKLVSDLSGHRDEIYAMDWAHDGTFLVSGGKDGLVKIWRY